MSAKKNEAGLWETEIDGQKYEFEKWGGEDGTDALLDLFAVLGKPIGQGVAALFGKAADGDNATGLNRKMDPNVVGMIIEALSDRVGTNKALTKDLIKKLSTKGVFCAGARVSYDQHFRDRYGHLLKVVQAGLEVQFSSFFGEGSGNGGFLQSVAGIMNRGTPT